MWSPPPTVPSSSGPWPFALPSRKLGFFERLRIGWQLTKVSLGILRKEKGLIVLPFLSLLLTGAAWLVFLISIFFFTATPTNPFGYWLFYVGLAIVYYVTFFVSIYFNAAVMGAAMIRLNGGDPTVSDGLKVANQNLKRIAGWALVSATVGLVLRAIAERFGVIGRIVAGFAGVAWGIATYLVVPVLIFEKIGPWAAVKRSGSLLRKTWGEAAGGYLTLGAIHPSDVRSRQGVVQPDSAKNCSLGERKVREKDVPSWRGARLPVTQNASPVDRRLSLFTSNQNTRSVWSPATAQVDPYGAGIPNSGLAEPLA